MTRKSCLNVRIEDVPRATALFERMRSRLKRIRETQDDGVYAKQYAEDAGEALALLDITMSVEEFVREDGAIDSISCEVEVGPEGRE